MSAGKQSPDRKERDDKREHRLTYDLWNCSSKTRTGLWPHLGREE